MIYSLKMQGSKILIIGGGAIGRSIACLSSSKFNCILITNSDCQSPHTLLSENDSKIYNFDVRKILPSDPDSYRLILIASKAYQLNKAFKSLNEWSNKNHTIIFLQNGLGIFDEAISQNFTFKKIIRGILYYGASISTPAVTNIVGIPKITLAPCDSNETDISKFFIHSGFQVSLNSNSKEIEWQKALVSLSLVLVSASRNETNDIVLRDPDAKQECLALLSEARLIALSEGVDLSSITDDALLESVKNYGKNRNALLIDLEKGRQTELPWTLDRAIDIAAKNGVYTHNLKRIRDKLKGMT